MKQGSGTFEIPPHPNPGNGSGTDLFRPPFLGEAWGARSFLGCMAPEIAVLFPDRSLDSLLGEMPVGWEEAVLDEIVLLSPEMWATRHASQTVLFVNSLCTKWGTIERRETYQ